MTGRIMTRDAGAVSIRAFEHAVRLGHPYLGGEHYLLARAARDVHRRPGRFSPRRCSGATRGDGVFLPHGPGVNQALVAARREAAARHAAQADVGHLALGILAAGEGLVPTILSRLGTSGPALGTAILDRYPSAS
ncbi:Clp protease N-terminal domain-containing protein [Trebonia sp.]|uniref:Clp protease N-terminal domain-containing protein n=1 Tax=Trebonia sp. TaxID=2767075 RepID=UPI00262737CA|nr:Clp protease N-terminal domain-containing protein [Trebonia sp.]